MFVNCSESYDLAIQIYLLPLELVVEFYTTLGDTLGSHLLWRILSAHRPLEEVSE